MRTLLAAAVIASMASGATAQPWTPPGGGWGAPRSGWSFGPFGGDGFWCFGFDFMGFRFGASIGDPARGFSPGFGFGPPRGYGWPPVPAYGYSPIPPGPPPWAVR